MAEQAPLKRKVVGSMPTVSTVGFAGGSAAPSGDLDQVRFG